MNFLIFRVVQDLAGGMMQDINLDSLDTLGQTIEGWLQKIVIYHQDGWLLYNIHLLDVIF